MEMTYYRGNFKPPRRYYPWDPLQLDENIHGGWRPNKNEVLFNEFKVYLRELYWLPLLYKSQMYFYDDLEQLENSLTTLMRQNKKFSSGTCVFEAYSFDKNSIKYNKILQKLDDDYFFMHYHPYDETLEHFVDELLKYREMIKIKTQQSSLLEPTSKRLQFFLLKIDGDALNELKKNILLREKLKNLIKKSTDQRMYFFIYSEKAENFPNDVTLSSDFTIFIGDDNENYCSNVLYPNYPKRSYYISRIVYGVAVTDRYEEIMPIHSIARKTGKSEWVINKKAEEEEEARIYREFLESLDDGGDIYSEENYSWENKGSDIID